MPTSISPTDSHLLHRQGTAKVAVQLADGRYLSNTAVSVEQVGHSFEFGNIGFDLISFANGEGAPARGDLPSDEALAELHLGVFNAATLPFYWANFEKESGRPDTARMLRAAQWFADRGVTVKGHPLVWHTLSPWWLLSLDERDVEAVVRARVTKCVTDFRGVIDLWDVVNEAVIMPVFDKEDNAITRWAQRIGRVGVIRIAFEAAREANPDARLVLNDFDLSADYEQLIEECLSAGVPIDAIGLQTHMHQGYRGDEGIEAILARFARFGLPLQLTEVTLVSGDLMPPHILDLNDYQVPQWPSTPEGEARQARELAGLYRTAFAHPAVESIAYWGLTDAGAWLGAPAGLLRADGSPKPGYDALRGLIKDEWWLSPTTLVTGADGTFDVSGFAGTYRVTAAGQSADLEVERGKRTRLDVILN